MDTRDRAKRYNKIKIHLKLVDIFFIVAFLLVFQFCAAAKVKSFAYGLTGSFYLSLGVYFLIFAALYYAAGFPLHYYSDFVLERRFQLTNQRFQEWIKDDLKKGALSFFISAAFIYLFYFFLKTFPVTWWIWMASFWFAVTILLAKITPVVIIPLFFKYLPVDENLKSKIMDLSEKCGISILDVYKIDLSRKTNKLNAALTGFGGTKRVLLGDNLVNEFEEREVIGVLAHEFGHYKLAHIWKLLGFGLFSIFFTFFVLNLAASGIAGSLQAEGIYDLRIFPSLMLIIFAAGFLILPLQNGFSRKLEKDADVFALKVTGDRDAFISLMEKLANKNLADPNPSRIIRFIFYDHPPVRERIDMARNISLEGRGI